MPWGCHQYGVRTTEHHTGLSIASQSSPLLSTICSIFTWICDSQKGHLVRGKGTHRFPPMVHCSRLRSLYSQLWLYKTQYHSHVTDYGTCRFLLRDRRIRSMLRLPQKDDWHRPIAWRSVLISIPYLFSGIETTGPDQTAAHKYRIKHATHVARKEFAYTTPIMFRWDKFTIIWDGLHFATTKWRPRNMRFEGMVIHCSIWVIKT